MKADMNEPTGIYCDSVLELGACLLLANPLRSVLSALFIAAACLSGTGCVSGNKAEANLIKVEKQSTAAEVDQYVTTAGRIARFFKQGSE